MQVRPRAARDPGPSAFENLSRALAVGIPRRRAFRLLGLAAVIEVVGGLGTGPARPQVAQATQIPDCVWRVDGAAGPGICGGCTSGGGTACFGQNTCHQGCLSQETRDYCGALKGPPSRCCLGCNAPCQANVPCLQGATPNTVLSDNCPRHPGVRSDCEYYARRNDCTGGKCNYYSITAPKYCQAPPPTLPFATDQELSCIRQCLQISDANNGVRTADGCPKNSPIVDYHDQCFEACGFSELRFPEIIFRWGEANDGD